MRGKLPCIVLDASADGITPAYAGKTLLSSCVIVGVEDHPRVCGENCMMWNPRIMTKGSPPRMRGKPLTARKSCRTGRITPAYAGKTIVGNVTCVYRQGSPPRMRGKPFPFLRVRAGSRITPAYAGKTIIYHRMHSESRDHPRVCGENQVKPRCIAHKAGITPAYAGKTR